MGRRGGGGGGRRSSPARSPPPARRAPPPAQAPAAPPPAQAGGGGMMSGMAGSMMSGMATGVGFSMANRAVDAVMGNRQTDVVHRNEDGSAPAAQEPSLGAQSTNSQQSQVCGIERDMLNQCMQQATEHTQCNNYLEMMKQCQKNSSAM